MKQADVAEDPEAFHHVGLLITEPPGLGRAAPQLIFRRIHLTAAEPIRDQQTIRGLNKYRPVDGSARKYSAKQVSN